MFTKGNFKGKGKGASWSKGKDKSKGIYPARLAYVSNINGTVEDFRVLLLVPVLSKSTKISPDVYHGLSLGGSSGAELPSDKATAQKRIWAFLKLCAKFIPCEHEAYDLAVTCLDAEVDDDLSKAWTVLRTTQEQCLPEIVKTQRKAASVLLKVLYMFSSSLETTGPTC